MTDKLASLSCLSNIDCIERIKALDDFYNQWKKDTNVIDKWFTIQATSKLNNTLNIVKKLSKHKLFDIKNPNKVRSLINSFANLNPTLFNTTK
ncbi:aminopeptidase N C-terminal domain-containing protein [bacterium]|nr:aminopeptidase N C-terminal domain-containing protein [bacterium]